MIAILGLAAALAALGLTMSLDSGGGSDHLPSPPTAAVEPVRPALPLPAFDVVRVGEMGDVVVAGRAAPRAEVVLWDGGREVGRVVADDRGEWVLVPTETLVAGLHVLSLEARLAEGAALRSADTVYLVVPDHGGQGAVAVAARPGDARLMLGAPAAAGTISLDLISRDGASLFVSGRAPAGAAVRLVLDDRPLGAARADAEGNWSLSLSETATQGRLRAEIMDDRGRPRDRAEAPLAPPAAGAAPLAGDGGRWVVVRRGGATDAYTVLYGAGN